jgi:hypothetical protein
MNNYICVGLSSCLAACALVWAGTSAAQTYSPGAIWHRSSDWVQGTVPGSTLGNAAVDGYGSPVWRYGSVTGGSQTSADPWFENTSDLMVWDDEWWGSAVGGVWARGYNGPGAENIGTNPPISRYGMFHDLSAKTLSYQYTSVIDWVNPVGNGAIVNFGGSFKFLWEGHFSSDSPAAPIEAVIARYDSSEDHYDVLWSGQSQNPTAGSALSPDSKTSLAASMAGVRFDQGDWLRFSFRSTAGESQTPLWIAAEDAFLLRLVTVVPEPSESILLGAGSVLLVAVLAGRRRREVSQTERH